MNTASLELCKELYELTGWCDTEYHYWNSKVSNSIQEITLNWGYKNYQANCFPAYDLGYLLRRLPQNSILTWNREDGAIIHYSSWTFTGGVLIEGKGWDYDSDFENAACKLAIELFKSGILTKGQEQ